MKMSHTLNCGEHARLNTILSKNVPLLFSLGNEKKSKYSKEIFFFNVKKEMSDILNPKINEVKQWTSLTFFFLAFSADFCGEKKYIKDKWTSVSFLYVKESCFMSCLWFAVHLWTFQDIKNSKINQKKTRQAVELQLTKWWVGCIQRLSKRLK